MCNIKHLTFNKWSLRLIWQFYFEAVVFSAVLCNQSYYICVRFREDPTVQLLKELFNFPFLIPEKLLKNMRLQLAKLNMN